MKYQKLKISMHFPKLCSTAALILKQTEADDVYMPQITPHSCGVENCGISIRTLTFEIFKVFSMSPWFVVQELLMDSVQRFFLLSPSLLPPNF